MTSKSNARPVLPQGTIDSAKRWTVYLGSIFFILLAFFTFISLLTYNSTDSSINTAVQGSLKNFFGARGAAWADFLYQFVGRFAWVFPLGFLFWAKTLFSGQVKHFIRQPLAFILGILLLAAVVSSSTGSFDRFVLLGGGGGTVVKSWLTSLGLPAFLVSLLYLVLGLWLLNYALGVNWSEVRSFFGFAKKNVARMPELAKTKYASLKAGQKEGSVDSKGLATRLESPLSIIKNRFLRKRKSVHTDQETGEEFGVQPEEASGEEYPRRWQPGKAIPIRQNEESYMEPEQEEAPLPTYTSPPEPLYPRGEEQVKPNLGALIEEPIPSAAPLVGQSPQPVKQVDTARVQQQASFLEGAAHQLPPLSILQEKKTGVRTQSQEELAQKAAHLTQTLEEFGVKGEVVKVRPGPVITLYEFLPAPGVKTARVIGLADDMARSMSALSARIAVVPGHNAIGIELPNEERETVYLRELISSEAYQTTSAKLPMCLGKSIGGEAIIVDMAKMPHLLVAGTTGSGKSVAVNTMILSILYKLSPDQCKFIMIDPKMLELSVYDGIPHLLSPVVTDPKKAVVALKWAVQEMENRYRLMSQLAVRNIDGYNKRINKARKNGEILTRKIQTGFDPETGSPIMEEQEIDLTPMPYIIVIIDEMADLMLVAGKDIEAALQRLAQMARASGIHVITATQRPSVDVITGTIKANFPSRISFSVSSKIDSRTVLGEPGAEQLLGMGDMLYMPNGGRIERAHGAFASDEEVEDIAEFLRDQGEPDYVAVTEENSVASQEGGPGGGNTEKDELYDQAVQIVIRDRKASISYIQRQLQIGYNRAARLVEQMEGEGVISEPSRGGKREILVGKEQE